jgi:hypothetical protein
VGATKRAQQLKDVGRQRVAVAQLPSFNGGHRWVLKNDATDSGLTKPAEQPINVTRHMKEIFSPNKMWFLQRGVQVV